MEEAMEYIEDKFTLSSGLCSHIISYQIFYVF